MTITTLHDSRVEKFVQFERLCKKDYTEETIIDRYNSSKTWIIRKYWSEDGESVTNIKITQAIDGKKIYPFRKADPKLLERIS